MIHGQRPDGKLLDTGFQYLQAAYCHEAHGQRSDRRSSKSNRSDCYCAC